MRILVTGAAGFVGSHIVEALLAEGHEVQGLDSLAPAVHAGLPGYLPGSFELAVGDVRDPVFVRRALAGADVVCHQAALTGLGVDLSDLPAYADVNGTGTAVLLEAMGRSGISRLVLASSMAVYGEGARTCAEHGRVRPAPRPPAALAAGRFEPGCPQCGAVLVPAPLTEDMPLAPASAYAASKAAQEQLAAAWARMTGGSAIVLRYASVYGPRLPQDTPYAGVAAAFRSALAGGRAPQLYEDGRQLRDFIHVRDVARANVAAVRAAEPGLPRAFNITSGDPQPVGELARRLAGVLGGPAPEVTGRFRLGDVRHVVACADAAASGLGFRAAVSFASGLAELAQGSLRGATVGLPIGDRRVLQRHSWR
jgi:dTDP-L-rhamnose 4-epimerase